MLVEDAMITIVGVGHVFDIKRQVRDVIVGQAPNVVAVELDGERYQALLHPQVRKDLPPTYRILSKFQKRLADEFGGELGSEMLAAVDASKELGVDCLFIDANAGALFTHMLKVMPFKERVLLFFSAVTGLFASKKRVEAELDRFTQNEEMYLKQFERQFPTLKRVLIDDRNHIMANNLAQAEMKYGSVVAIVGDGHVDGLGQLLAGSHLQVVRLKQLLDNSYPKGFVAAKEGGAEISYQYTVSMEEEKP
ncbi:MAG: TraB/GumN family protein [Methanomassiliicoccales archaeon]|nr:TraB/GumN family protein [Methanomassiliicoccales archaeon]